MLLLRGLRLRLTAWYVGILCCILIVISFAAAFAVQRALASETDRTLMLAAQSQVEQAEHFHQGGDEVTLGTRGINAVDPDETYTPGTGDIFVLSLDSKGQIAANPRGVQEPGLPVAASAAAALQGRRDLRTVSLDGKAFRILSQPLRDGGAVQVGRSLESSQHELHEIELALTLAGVAGLAFAAAGGMLLAGRALAPVHEGIRRQRIFVADASHELRAPLTLIRATAETLLRGARSQSHADTPLLHDLIDETDRLARLVSDLLLLARLDERPATLAEEIVDLGGVVRIDAERIRSVLDGRQMQLSLPDAPLLVSADPDRLEQLFLILLDNAVKYTPRNATIAIEAHRAGGQAEVTVTDNGPGLSMEAMAHAFDRFYRGDDARARPGGTGLGLAIARAIADASRGSLQLSTPALGGLRAVVRLPLAKSI